MLRMRGRSWATFVEPCLPSPGNRPPDGSNWIHEIKHDGFRLMARRDSAGVRLFTPNSGDFTRRFPLAAAAVTALPGRSFLIDGEAIVIDDRGLAVFELVRRARHGGVAVFCAFDLIELEGEDLRCRPIEHRKHKLAKLIRTPHPGIVLNEYYEGDGEIVFEYACKLGCEGIVSKRLGSPYRSGRTDCWVKVRNPQAPAMKREAEEDWDR
ncbi:MAG: DNA ligase [Xanthobacteraceae bacterium]